MSITYIKKIALGVALALSVLVSYAGQAHPADANPGRKEIRLEARLLKLKGKRLQEEGRDMIRESRAMKNEPGSRKEARKKKRDGRQLQKKGKFIEQQGRLLRRGKISSDNLSRECLPASRFHGSSF
jgi:hypothetical protein